MALRRCLSRAQSTVASAVPIAPAAAAPAATAPTLSDLAAIAAARLRSGHTVSQEWNRYVIPDAEPFSLSEARKGKNVRIDAPLN